MVTHNNRINPDDINTYVIYGHGKATKAKAKSGIHSLKKYSLKEILEIVLNTYKHPTCTNIVITK